jgi:tRNA 2-selenouridine synthase
MVTNLQTELPQTEKRNSMSVESFLQKRDAGCPVIDVRSPAEYEKGHVPGALNLPLFSNEERALIGTLYMKYGKEDAISRGLEIIGPKLKEFARQGLSLADNQEVLVYCWRGGMRSSSMAWLFETVGIHASVLAGGYKSYRHYIHDFLSYPFTFIVIGGMTGSGKTEILVEMRKLRYPVINLEELACHKGSVFGAIGEPPQPTPEQFENLLFESMASLNRKKPIFIEDESISIGAVFLPRPFHKRMLECPLINLVVPYKDRITRLVKHYACTDKEVLIQALKRIEKRIGREDTQRAICLIREGNIEEAVTIILRYYDKVYYRTMKVSHDDEKRINLELMPTEIAEYARQVIECAAYKNLL